MTQLEFPFAPIGTYIWYYKDGRKRIFTEEEITFNKNGYWKPKDLE